MEADRREALRLGLARLVQRRAGGGRSSPPAPARHRRQALLLEDVFPGRAFETSAGSVFVYDTTFDAGNRGYERLVVELRDAMRHLAEVPADEIGADYDAIREHGLESLAFLDLETGGLAGQPIFLAGILRVRGARLELRQILVRRYAEEPALVALVADELEHTPVLVSYNGKTFDVPMLADRARYHHVAFGFEGRHVDLLHAARRRYRSQYPNCKLTTLEWYVCHRRRSGDVPGFEIPGRFHRFMQDGDPFRLIPILHHNALDLVTLAELTGHLAPEPSAPRFVPDYDALHEMSLWSGDRSTA